MDPAEATGEYIGVTLIEAAAATDLAAALARPGSATRSCTTRTATRSSSTAASGSTSRRSATSTGSRSTTTTTSPGRGRSYAGTDPADPVAGRRRHPAGRAVTTWRRSWPTSGSRPPAGWPSPSAAARCRSSARPSQPGAARRRLVRRRRRHHRRRGQAGRADPPQQLRRGGRPRRRQGHRRGQVRRGAGRPADGRGGHEPRARRHLLAGRHPGQRRRPRLVRRARADRGASSTST